MYAQEILLELVEKRLPGILDADGERDLRVHQLLFERGLDNADVPLS